jgi:hypothetical protein
MQCSSVCGLQHFLQNVRRTCIQTIHQYQFDIKIYQTTFCLCLVVISCNLLLLQRNFRATLKDTAFLTSTSRCVLFAVINLGGHCCWMVGKNLILTINIPTHIRVCAVSKLYFNYKLLRIFKMSVRSNFEANHFYPIGHLSPPLFYVF